MKALTSEAIQPTYVQRSQRSSLRVVWSMLHSNRDSNQTRSYPWTPHFNPARLRSTTISTNQSVMLRWSLGIALWLVGTCGLCVSFLPSNANWIAVPLIFFNNLNIFITFCEISLLLRIDFIQADYLKLRERYGGGQEWSAIMALFCRPITFGDMVSAQNWARMWSNYALFDPSYQNRESFGFWIDVGNGFTTILPCLLLNWVLLVPMEKLSTELKATMLWLVPCVTIASYWQMLYGTLVYFATFVFNQRYHGHEFASIMAFVLVTNLIWIIFPALAIYCAVRIVQEGSFNVLTQ